mmetsp:Transcript_57666/g.159508  ORF Transcript_57666/g.159508 Transcript_57666/m.159508 type:complete len:140 (-) Transcript_57666:213-632(-)
MSVGLGGPPAPPGAAAAATAAPSKEEAVAVAVAALHRAADATGKAARAVAAVAAAVEAAQGWPPANPGRAAPCGTEAGAQALPQACASADLKSLSGLVEEYAQGHLDSYEELSRLLLLTCKARMHLQQLELHFYRGPRS